MQQQHLHGLGCISWGSLAGVKSTLGKGSFVPLLKGKSYPVCSSTICTNIINPCWKSIPGKGNSIHYMKVCLFCPLMCPISLPHPCLPSTPLHSYPSFSHALCRTYGTSPTLVVVAPSTGARKKQKCFTTFLRWLTLAKYMFHQH